MIRSYDAWKTMSPEDAGFYRFDEPRECLECGEPACGGPLCDACRREVCESDEETEET